MIICVKKLGISDIFKKPDSIKTRTLLIREENFCEIVVFHCVEAHLQTSLCSARIIIESQHFIFTFLLMKENRKSQAVSFTFYIENHEPFWVTDKQLPIAGQE